MKFDVEVLAKSLHQHSFWDDAKPWEELDTRAKNDWREMALRFVSIYGNGGRK